MEWVRRGWVVGRRRSRSGVGVPEKVDSDQVVQAGVRGLHSDMDMHHVVEIAPDGAFSDSCAACHKDDHSEPLGEYLKVWD